MSKFMSKKHINDTRVEGLSNTLPDVVALRLNFAILCCLGLSDRPLETKEINQMLSSTLNSLTNGYNKKYQSSNQREQNNNELSRIRFRISEIMKQTEDAPIIEKTTGCHPPRIGKFSLTDEGRKLFEEQKNNAPEFIEMISNNMKRVENMNTEAQHIR